MRKLKKEYSEIELKKVFNECNNVTQVLSSLGLSDNTPNREMVKSLGLRIGVNVITFGKNPKKVRYCEECGEQLDGKFKLKFCNNSCSAKYNNKLRKKKNKASKVVKKQLKPKLIKEKRIKTPKFCKNCGIELIENKTFCSLDCNGVFNHKKAYNDFLSNPEKYCRPNYTPKGFKVDFLNEQNGLCDICGCDDNWNGNKLVFVLDHIDGDASNNRRENLRLICPNCDSQTDTFKSKNKLSNRRNYWKEKILREKNRNTH